MEKIKEFLRINKRYGCGDGCGYGDGDGDGSGYGCGDGYGDIGKINGLVVYGIDNVQAIIYHVRGNIAKGAILGDDLMLTPCYIVKGNNMFAHGETLTKAQEALRDKMFEDMDEDERIDAFLNEFKSGIKYPAKLFFNWHNRLTGSCEMGRKAFCKNHEIDVETATFTVQEYIELTENDYGGEIISRLKERTS